MNEVNVDVVDGRYELRQCVQPRFHLAPVVVSTPVPNQLLQIGGLHALRLVGDGFLVGPSPGRKTPAEIDDHFLRNVDLERPNCAVLGRSKLIGQEADSGRGCRGCQNVSAVWQLSRRDFLVRFSCPALIWLNLTRANPVCRDAREPARTTHRKSSDRLAQRFE
jgi:hypothetical protein